MKPRLYVRFVFCATAFLAITLSARAQGDTGRIEGRISDTQQLAIPQPTVEVQSQGKTLQRIVGDGTGHYQFTGLPAGSYTLQFSHSGFELATKESVSVSSGQTTVLDMVLQPQQMIQNIVVAASAYEDRQVGTKTDIPLEETPVTVQAVPLEVIQRQGAPDLVAVVNNIPGAYAMTQYGVYDYFVLRGFQMTNDPGSAVLLNGMRVEGNRVNTQVNSVESVEVLKGPASFLYGTQATGGTINIVQKRPLPLAAYEVGAHGGRWGTGGFDFGMTGPLGSEKFLYRLDGAFERSDGFRGAGWRRFNLTPAAFWRITPRDQLNLHITYNENRYDLDAGIPLQPQPDGSLAIPSIPVDRRFNAPGSFEKQSSPLLQAFYEHSVNENTRIREAFQYQYQGDEYFESEGLDIDPSTPDTVDRFNLYFNHFNRNIVSQTDFLSNFNWGWKHQVVVGYEYDRFALNTKRSSEASNADVPSINLFNPIETATAITVFPASRYDVSVNQSNALYFQDYMRLHPRVQVMVSGRFDGYRRTARRGLDPETQFTQNPFTYRVALNGEVTRNLSLYTSYGTTFEAQTNLAPTGATLDPQTGWQYEAGARLNLLQDRLTFNAAAYRLVENNIVVFRTIDLFDQNGQQSSTGVELEVRGRASQRLTWFANYGFTRARFDNFVSGGVDISGNVPAFAPRHTARVWGTYDFSHGLGIQLGSRYVSSRATDFSNTLFVGGFTTWDAGVFYRRSNIEYSVNVTNFTNKTNYFVSAIIFDFVQVYPGPPVNVAGTIRYRFGKP